MDAATLDYLTFSDRLIVRSPLDLPSNIMSALGRVKTIETDDFSGIIDAALQTDSVNVGSW